MGKDIQKDSSKQISNVYNLNKEQLQAVTETEGAMLVVAGPGSGKTRVLTAKIAELINTGKLDTGAVLAVTFTNKASQEMSERVAKMVDSDLVKKVWISTFHSFCLRVLRSNPSKANISGNFQVLDTDDCKKLIKDALKALGAPHEQSDCRRIQSIISYYKNTGSRLNQQEQEVYDIYQNYLRDLVALDFDDILLYTKSALDDLTLREKYRKLFKHIMIDEFQDTNLLQYEIIKSISNGNITCVGDMDQSIYSWRGSSPEVMNYLEKDFKNLKVVVLEKNYRSTPEILDVCRSIIKPNPAKHRPSLVTSNPSGEGVKLLEFDSDREEVRYIVSEIERDNSETAIIVRVNSQTRLIEEALNRAAINYQVIGGIKFYERAEIKDMLSYLKLAVNDRDTLSFTRVINLPRRKIGDATLNYILTSAKERGVSPLQFCRSANNDKSIPASAKKGITDFVSHIDQIRVLAKTNPSSALKYILTETNLKEHYENDKSVGGNKIQNVLELIYVAEESKNSATVQIDDFTTMEHDEFNSTLLFLERASLGSSKEVESSKVQIMTAHASKGREFNSVYIVGLEEGLFPHYLKDEEPDEQEERRLLFVAASRAMKKLTLTISKSRVLFGSIKENKQSRFIKDLNTTKIRADINNFAYLQDMTDQAITNRLGKIGFRAKSATNTRNSTPASRKNRVATPSGERVSIQDATEGRKVKHEYFGYGVIVKVNGLYATIEFEDSSREISLPIAPMQLVD